MCKICSSGFIEIWNSSVNSPALPRHPDHHLRPTFEDITIGLAEDPEVILCWREEDKAVSPKAVALGAPMEEGKHLYKELQDKYK